MLYSNKSTRIVQNSSEWNVQLVQETAYPLLSWAGRKSAYYLSTFERRENDCKSTRHSKVHRQVPRDRRHHTNPRMWPSFKNHSRGESASWTTDETWRRDYRRPTTCSPCSRGLLHVLENYIAVSNWAWLDVPRQQLLSTYQTRKQAEAARLGSTTSQWHFQRRHLDGRVYSPNGITPPLLLSKARGSSSPQTEVMYGYISWNVHVYVHYTGT